MRLDFHALCVLAAGFATASALAAPIAPMHDDDVVEVLPPVAGSNRSEDRRLREQLARRPDDPQLAVNVARRRLDQAREQGDARFVGLATAALQRWSDPASDPPAVVYMQANLLQYQHDFDRAGRLLEQLLRRQPTDAQALLTLATVRRVQGRYDDSDAACRRLAVVAPGLYAEACSAENAGLRGEIAGARATFQRLVATPGLDPSTQGWLLTSLAELEDRAGNAMAAESRWRAALQADPNAYASIGYADFLLSRGQPRQAMASLARLPRSDAVLLRLAIAGGATGSTTSIADAQELRERIALANQRPGTEVVHGREQAMFALLVDRQPARALELARKNVERQREPVDLLLLARAARARDDRDALKEVRALCAAVGLRDARIEALL